MTGTALCCAGGVEEAFSLYADQVLSFSLGYLGQLEQAEDFASATWEKATRFWHKFDGRNPLGWLRTILKNEIRMALRHNGYHLPDARLENYHKPGYVPRALIVEDDLDLALANLEKDGPIFTAFRSLPPIDRQALSCRLTVGKDSEAAAKIGIGVSAYRVRVFRAKAKVREMLAHSQ